MLNRTIVKILGGLSVLAGCSSIAMAQNAINSNDPLIARREAGHWLDRIQKAALQQNYVGTFVYQQGSGVQSSHIAHYSDMLGNEFEQIEGLDGTPREALRQNEMVYTLLRNHRLRLVDKRENKDTFPALIANPNIDVLAAYELRKLNVDRVAGQECQQLALVPKDNLRYGYRLCVDARSGLLLRAQTLAENGKVLEQIAFSQVHIGAPNEKIKIQNALKITSAWAQQNIAVQTANMSQQGWLLEANQQGFKKLKELQRPVATGANAQVKNYAYQVIYSDGLAGISVFIEPINGKQQHKEGQMHRGATNVMSKRLNQYWVTVVGEAPMATVKQFTQSVEKKAAP